MLCDLLSTDALCEKESVKNACYIGMMVLGLLLMMHPLQLPLLYSTNGRGYFSFFAGIMLAQMMEKTSDEKRTSGVEAHYWFF